MSADQEDDGDPPPVPPPAAVRVLHEGEFLRLLRDAHWEYVQRQHATGAGFIIALTAERELLLVEQLRLPLRRRVIELPAGIIADSAATAGESVQASALRELEEETGYRGSRAQIVCHGPVAAGMTSEIGWFTRVHDLQRVGDGGGVEGEDITVHRVSLSQVDAWLADRQADGILVDPRIFIALYFLGREPASTEA